MVGEDKIIAVQLGEGRPKFQFKGLWTGKDIQVVLRNIPVAYRMHVRDIRLRRVTVNKLDAPTTVEVKAEPIKKVEQSEVTNNRRP